MKLVIDVDDVYPERGYGYYDKEIEYLDSLHDEFGCKFTLFMPTCYHDIYPLTDHASWFSSLAAKPYFELACHGDTHEGIGSELEFQTDPNAAEAKIVKSLAVFEELEYKAVGFRPPGWDYTPGLESLFAEYFEYYCTNFRGTTAKGKNIPYTYNIHEPLSEAPENEFTILHSHINPSCGDNGWNDELYEKVKAFLKDKDVQPFFMKEIVE